MLRIHRHTVNLRGASFLFFVVVSLCLGFFFGCGGNDESSVVDPDLTISDAIDIISGDQTGPTDADGDSAAVDEGHSTTDIDRDLATDMEEDAVQLPDQTDSNVVEDTGDDTSEEPNDSGSDSGSPQVDAVPPPDGSGDWDSTTFYDYTIPIAPQCEELCVLFSDCDVYDYVGMSPEGCVDECSFTAAAIGSGMFDPYAACLEDALGEGRCDVLNTVGCEQPIFCPEVCENVSDCAPGTPLSTEFSDPGSCMTFCESLETGPAAAWVRCMEVSECESACDDLPTEPSDDCETACAAVLGLCADETGMTEALYCPWQCMGELMGLSFADASGADVCIGELPECMGEIFDDDLEIPYAPSLFLCMVWVDECEPICADLNVCITEAGFFHECMVVCSLDTAEDPGLRAEVAACVDAAGSDCDAVEDCVPE